MIIVIPYNGPDQARAERLCDAIHWLGKSCFGLIVPCPDVHAEFKKKVELAAKVGFDSYEVFEPAVIQGDSKWAQINSLFGQVCERIANNYKMPWLWLEPGCVPLEEGWSCKISQAYDARPERYMGAYMQGADKKFLNRVAVYPHNAADDLLEHCNGPAPFHRVADILPAAYKSSMFKVAKWEPGMNLTGTVLLDSDKSGGLIDQVIEKADGPKLASTK